MSSPAKENKDRPSNSSDSPFPTKIISEYQNYPSVEQP